MTARPFVLLDRDGTIIEERHYLSEPSQVELIPGAVVGLRRLRELGFGLLVVTNQSGIRRGLFDARQLECVHERMRELLSREGVFVDGIYYCPHRPEDECQCRKPGTALVRRAAQQFGFDPVTAFVVGDKEIDIELGRNVGATTFLVRTGYGAQVAKHGRVSPDYIVDDLAAAALIIEALLQHGKEAKKMQSDTDYLATIRAALLASADLKRATATACDRSIFEAACLVAETFRSGGKVLLCGNGGSAADCQHMAAEFVSRFRKEVDRPGLPAMALTTDTSFLTAFANDCGYEGVFERQVETLGRPGDLLIAISTSGASKNVLLALQAAAKKQMHTVALTGPKGMVGAGADVTIPIPSTDTQRIQEAHLAVEHVVCELVETMLFPEKIESLGIRTQQVGAI